MNKISTMNDFSRNAVEEFVQTVVLVDDEIYTPKGAVIEGKFTGPKRKKPSTKSAEIKANQTSAAEISNEEKFPFSFHDIQAKFAKKSIVCSPHQPRNTDSLGKDSIAYNLCSAADIVIVDWALGDAGEKATSLIENLVRQSLKKDPHQLRLVLIYTSEPNLFDIADKVSKKLAEEIPDKIEDRVADKGLAFHTPNARVVVLGKPGHRRNEEEGFEVSESGLADRAITEFCKLTDGMLQGGILKGLAAIRKQSRRILTKFHSGLDAAFLTHRALRLSHEDAFEHIAPLLVAEIEAVLEDSLPRPLISDIIISSWCDKRWVPAPHASQFLPHEVDVHKFATDLCTKGMNIANYYSSGKKTNLEKTIKSLKKDTPKWPSINEDSFKALSTYLSKDSLGSDLRELSILMSQRTYYGDHRHLTLGTIIRESGGEKRYMLCLQPTCDSIQLTNQTTFVFCSMEETDKGKATHVIGDGSDFADLIYKPKIEKCVTLAFKPSRERIAATELEFIDAKGQKTYQWIAQLKPKHAQGAVEQFARELSRVGLTESEWLRLKAK